MTVVKVTVIITSERIADAETVVLDYPAGTLLADVTKDVVRRLKGEKQ